MGRKTLSGVVCALLILVVFATGTGRSAPAGSQAEAPGATGLAAAAGPSLQVGAPRKVEVGEPITLSLTVQNAADIAGYETDLLFDTGVAEFDSLVQRNKDLSTRFGRGIEPLGAVETSRGVSIGAYSCPFTRCVRPGTEPKKTTGGRGTVRLATVSVISYQPGNFEIGLSATRFVNAAGNPVNVGGSTQNLLVQVGPSASGPLHPAPGATPREPAGQPPSPPGPFNLTGDNLVSHADSMEASIAWTLQREKNSPCDALITPSRDVNHDGCIDVSDLQMIAANYSLPQADAAAPETRKTSTSLVTGAVSSLADWMGTSAALAAEVSTFTVNSTADDVDAKIGDRICATAAGLCTLRAAIAEANAHSGPDTVAFNIPGSGVQTIQLTKGLPSLNDASGPTTIDGYTQPGASPNTDPLVSNANIRVQIAGSGASGFDALFVTSSGNTIRGLAFPQLRTAVVLFGSGATNNVLAGNFVGTNAAGTSLAATTVPGGSGIKLQVGAANNRIGGTSAAERNVLSGSPHHGVATYDEATDANVILNNLIGLNPAGNNRLPNRNHGIDINTHSSDNVIGGHVPGERNVISGNGWEGVEVSHGRGTVGNRVVGNFIGTDVTGTSAPAYSHNVHYGLHLEDGVTNNVFADNIIGNNRAGGARIAGHFTEGNQLQGNRIGISANGSAIPNGGLGIQIDAIWLHAISNRIGPGNIITNNPLGIRVLNDEVDSQIITRNSIYGNTKMGIDLAPLDKVNPNDTDDADIGPNEQLNFPVLTSATPQTVSGTACRDAVVPGPCTVEVFLSDGGANAHGEGKTFAGSSTTSPDGTFTAQVSGLAPGDHVTATATDADGNTSEFSLNQGVADATPADTTAPTTQTASSPQPNAAGWNNTDVTVTLNATDNEGGSGVREITYSVNGSPAQSVPGDTAEILASEEGQNSISYFATDNAGNSEAEKTLAVKLDKTAPEITITTPPDGAGYDLDQPVAADYACADGGSGVDSCAGPVPSGSDIDTGSAGSKAFTVEARDVAGNTRSATNNYTVQGSLPSDAFSDIWTGADGSAWDASRWTTDARSGTLDTQLDEGRMRFENVSGARARAIAKMPKVADTEVLMSFRFTSNDPRGYLQVFSRASGDWAAGNSPINGYYMLLPNNERSVSLWKAANKTTTPLSSRSIGEVTTAKQWLRFRVQGNSLKVKVWTDGTPEPVAWEMEVTDTTVSAPGVLQLLWIRAGTSTDAREVRLDDLTVTNLDP